MMDLRRWMGMVALGAAVALPRAGSAETLTDVLIEAYRNSNLLDQNRAVLRAADENVAQAVATLRPVITAQASATYTRTPIIRSSSVSGLVGGVGATGGGVGATGGGVGATGGGFSGGGSDTTAALSLNAILTILDFGRGAANIAAKNYTVLATRWALVSVEQRVLLSAVQAYVNVRQSADQVRLSEANVRLIGQELKAVQDRFDVGEITRTDVAIAEAQLASARSTLAQSQGQSQIARESFRLAVGSLPRNLAPPPRSPRIPKTLEEARGIALRTHPDILQAQQQVSAADAGIAIANANFRPTLNGVISASDGPQKLDRASASITLSQTIYSGGQRSSLYRQALANRDQSRAILHQQSDVVSQSVGQAWAQLAVANATVISSNEQIRSAQIAFDGVREEAKLGARTTLDVLDAEQTLLQARITLLSSESQRYFGVYNLLSTMGLLTVDHLNLGIPTYDATAYYNAVKGAPVTSPQGRKLDRILKGVAAN